MGCEGLEPPTRHVRYGSRGDEEEASCGNGLRTLDQARRGRERRALLVERDVEHGYWPCTPRRRRVGWLLEVASYLSHRPVLAPIALAAEGDHNLHLMPDALEVAYGGAIGNPN